MTFIVVDNNRERLGNMTELLFSAFPGSTIYKYVDPMLSAKCALDHTVDAVFAEACMGRVDGMTLLHVLHCNKPGLPVVILSDDEQYRQTAMNEGAREYLMRPFTVQQLQSTMIRQDDTSKQTEKI